LSDLSPEEWRKRVTSKGGTTEAALAVLEKKSFGIASAERYSWEAILNELKKCMLLCSNCHMEKHSVDERYNVEIK